MTTPAPATPDGAYLSRAVEAAIRIGLVVLLAAWCFEIFRPFVVPVVWGMIIAVAAYPGYHRLEVALGGRRRTASAILVVLAMIVLIIPSAMLATTVVESAQGAADGLFADLAEATVRSVARGILGVALIQSLLAGLGFLAVGVPAAGLWALLCLLLSVVQIGIFPVTLPMSARNRPPIPGATSSCTTMWAVSCRPSRSPRHGRRRPASPSTRSWRSSSPAPLEAWPAAPGTGLSGGIALLYR